MRQVKLVSPNDETAREGARQLAGDCAVELWKGERKIADYPTNRGLIDKIRWTLRNLTLPW
ncbi:hypothetical protein [Bradyrhizobium arachidis]|uniref:hypothetical protein n=1 Tax=Bradyrhizobium arachidis TaxID=858423 RepID=UPI00188CDE50|nr:hypothetical protein [Bradyrhizobium arachidis]